MTQATRKLLSMRKSRHWTSKSYRKSKRSWLFTPKEAVQLTNKATMSCLDRSCGLHTWTEKRYRWAKEETREWPTRMETLTKGLSHSSCRIPWPLACSPWTFSWKTFYQHCFSTMTLFACRAAFAFWGFSSNITTQRYPSFFLQREWPPSCMPLPGSSLTLQTSARDWKSFASFGLVLYRTRGSTTSIFLHFRLRLSFTIEIWFFILKSQIFPVRWHVSLLSQWNSSTKSWTSLIRSLRIRLSRSGSRTRWMPYSARILKSITGAWQGTKKCRCTWSLSQCSASPSRSLNSSGTFTLSTWLAAIPDASSTIRLTACSGQTLPRQDSAKTTWMTPQSSPSKDMQWNKGKSEILRKRMVS